jgi:hypothetical protein
MRDADSLNGSVHEEDSRRADPPGQRLWQLHA